ncbi:MAG TPA: SGNH/GDSL hydrolase family protein [Candidatus Dormibacteraeota bacterium]|nr:SGNH/GDSL hydrolase family protein [Candidatus Dormibacteraeota bacterium]
MDFSRASMPRGRRFRRLGPLALLAAVCAVAFTVLPAATAAAQLGHDDRGRGWVGTWAASPVVGVPSPFPGLVCQAGTGVTNQTVRDVVFTSVGGDQVRVRLTNSFGSQPLTVGSASIAIAEAGAQAKAGTLRALTFGGARSITIPPGAEALSDPLAMDVPALQDLLVSVFVPNASGPATNHFDAQQDNFISAPGDFTLATSPAAFTTVNACSYFVDAVSVRARGNVAGSVVALGDSITDGTNSTVNANRRWPNDLARRLDARKGQTLSVVNAGIAGNQVLVSATWPGVNLLARLDRDVLTQPGARTVILLEGVNDIGASQATADQLIPAYRQVIAQVHARGLRILGATLTPYKGAFYWTPAGEQTREAVNSWILTSGAFDGVIDFARVTADPADPQVFNPAFDSGDHLHPNDAGYQAMADAIDIGRLLED